MTGPARATAYTVADVGIVPDQIINISGINNSGLVVGNTGSSGFTWSASGGYSALVGISGSLSTSARRVNDNGQIVGYSQTSGGRYACLWQNDQPAEDLGWLSSGGRNAAALGINDLGQVVGSSVAENGSTHAFLWDAVTGMRDLNGAASSDWASGYAVNDSGLVVGVYNNVYSFTWTASAGMDELRLPTHTPSVSACDVNDDGLILCNPLGQGQASIWQDGQIIVAGIGLLPVIDYVHSSRGHDINDAGQVVGTADHSRPFIWDSADGIQALPTQPGLSNQGAFAINNQGVIAGCGIDSSGVSHILIWTPVPEPSSLLALLAGVGGLGALLRRRRR